MLTPLKKMTPDAASAAQSSADSQPGPPQSAIEMPTNAAADVTASLRWCHASALTAVLPMSIPIARTRRARIHFVAITATSTTSVHAAGVRCGVRISEIASIAMPTAAASSMTDTTAAASGSATDRAIGGTRWPPCLTMRRQCSRFAPPSTSGGVGTIARSGVRRASSDAGGL